MPLPTVRVRSVSTTRVRIVAAPRSTSSDRDGAAHRDRLGARERCCARSGRPASPISASSRLEIVPPLSERAHASRRRSRAAPRPNRRSPSAPPGRATRRSEAFLAGALAGSNARSGRRADVELDVGVQRLARACRRSALPTAWPSAMPTSKRDTLSWPSTNDASTCGRSAATAARSACRRRAAEAQVGIDAARERGDRREAARMPPRRSPPARPRARPTVRSARERSADRRGRSTRSSAERARRSRCSPRVQPSSPARSVAPMRAFAKRQRVAARRRPSASPATRDRPSHRVDAAAIDERRQRRERRRREGDRGHRRAARGRCRRAGRRQSSRAPPAVTESRAARNVRPVSRKVSTGPVAALTLNGRRRHSPSIVDPGRQRSTRRAAPAAPRRAVDRRRASPRRSRSSALVAEAQARALGLRIASTL